MYIYTYTVYTNIVIHADIISFTTIPCLVNFFTLDNFF